MFSSKESGEDFSVCLAVEDTLDLFLNFSIAAVLGIILEIQKVRYYFLRQSSFLRVDLETDRNLLMIIRSFFFLFNSNHVSCSRCRLALI